MNDLFFTSGEVLLTNFTIEGFQYFRASSAVNVRDPSSMASASYSGELLGPYPPLIHDGFYDAEKDRVVFEEGITLPFFGLSLSFRTEVRLGLLSYITGLRFHGHLESPLFLNVTGILDGISCDVFISGLAELPSQGLTVQGDVLLDTCNCTTICDARAVSVMVNLSLPWNITLSGSYMLTDENVTEVTAEATQVEIAALSFNVSVGVRNEAGELSVQEIALDTHLQSPFNLDIHGIYSQAMGEAMLSGMLDLQPIVTLMLELTVNVETDMLSSLQFSGNISSPFMMSIFGSYSLLESNSSQIGFGGSVHVTGLVNFRGTIEIDLLTKTVFRLKGCLLSHLL